MAKRPGLLRKFKVHGAFGTKRKAKERERSGACGGRCFIRRGKVKGRVRYFVLEGR